MVNIMENRIQIYDLGGNPTIFGNIHIGACLDPGSQWVNNQKIIVFFNAGKPVNLQQKIHLLQMFRQEPICIIYI